MKNGTTLLTLPQMEAEIALYEEHLAKVDPAGRQAEIYQEHIYSLSAEIVYQRDMAKYLVRRRATRQEVAVRDLFPTGHPSLT